MEQVFTTYLEGLDESIFDYISSLLSDAEALDEDLSEQVQQLLLSADFVPEEDECRAQKLVEDLFQALRNAPGSKFLDAAEAQSVKDDGPRLLAQPVCLVDGYENSRAGNGKKKENGQEKNSKSAHGFSNDSNGPTHAKSDANSNFSQLKSDSSKGKSDSTGRNEKSNAFAKNNITGGLGLSSFASNMGINGDMLNHAGFGENTTPTLTQFGRNTEMKVTERKLTRKEKREEERRLKEQQRQQQQTSEALAYEKQLEAINALATLDLDDPEDAQGGLQDVHLADFDLPNKSGSGSLLTNASIVFVRARRYGLVGRNGVGKTSK